MGIRWVPLTPEQQRWVLSNGERVWTQAEIGIMRRNASFYESVNKLSFIRCRADGCGYAIQDSRIANAIPHVGVVCAVCWEMHKVVKQVNLNHGITGASSGY